jgi:hypothetical protein
MSPDTELRNILERALDDLPSVPAVAYLQEGRRVRRRRRAVATLVVVPVLALGGAVVLDQAGSAGEDAAPNGTDVATEVFTPPPFDPSDLGPDPEYVAPEPNNPVEAVVGLEGVDHFTTAGIPDWAQEYGSHGPVALTADGRLWVAPDATVRRTVVDPYVPGEDGITASYAVEAEYAGASDDLTSDVVWVIISTDGTGPGIGTMDEPGRWTDDFELWVDDATAHVQGRPSFAERLVTFANPGSSELVPASEGVQILHQELDPDRGPGAVAADHSAAAEVRWAGRTWYVLAVDPRSGAPWSDAHDGSSQTDFAAFLTWLRSGA